MDYGLKKRSFTEGRGTDAGGRGAGSSPRGNLAGCQRNEVCMQCRLYIWCPSKYKGRMVRRVSERRNVEEIVENEPLFHFALFEEDKAAKSR